MSTHSPWSRRRFLQHAGTLTAAVSGPLTLAHASLLSSSSSGTSRRYAYVGSAEGFGSLHVFAVEDAQWTPLQTIATLQPAALALHPSASVLYVANRVANCKGRPCGSVEAYCIDPQRGTLTKLGHQPLSLSATLPSDLAVSADGCHLIVAAYGGGAYNHLPLSQDGGLERVAGIVKETGCGPHPHHQRSAHPHSVVFDTTGKYLLGSDMGTDRLNSFRLEGSGLERANYTGLQEGSGPSQMVFHPFGHLIYVVNQLAPSVTAFAYHAGEGRVGKALWSSPLFPQDHASLSLAIHPTGQFLYTSGEMVKAWDVDGDFGRLRRLSQPQSAPLRGSRITMGQAGQSLFALHESSGEVRQARLDPSTGGLGQPQTVARVASPRSLLFFPSTGVAE